MDGQPASTSEPLPVHASLGQAARETLVAERRGPLDRALVLAGALGVFFLAREVLNPAWRRYVVDAPIDSLPAGPRMLAGHLVQWSLCMAVASLAAIAWLVRTGRLRRPSLRRDLRRAATDGAWAAGATIAVVVVFAAVTHMPFAFHFGPWSAAGNLVSNAYEEIAYRGLVFAAAWYATGRVSLAALVSGAVFGFTHEQYPAALRVLTGAVGALWSWAYARTGNLVAPWLAHELSDLVRDLFL